MIDKKTAAILVLLLLLAITGIGWLSSTLKPAPHGNIPYDNTYRWTEIFRGYEAYLDRRIFYFDNLEGTSMEPTFGEDDVVLWVEVDNIANLKVGDIVLFQHPTLADPPLIAHRIIEVGTQNGGYKFRTQGDNMPGPDQHWVPEGKIKGLVIGVLYRGPRMSSVVD